MDESGIDLGFDLSALSADQFDLDERDLEEVFDALDRQDYYELKSKSVPGTESPPSFKTATQLSRTQLRLSLQREQLQEQERRAKAAAATGSAGSDSASASVSAGRSLGPSPVPLVTPLPHNMRLPARLLQVTTALENPTRYHVIQKQRSQVLQYLNESAANGTPPPPPLGVASPAASPGLSSIDTSISEAEDLIDDLLSLEPSKGHVIAVSEGANSGSDVPVKPEPVLLSDAEMHALVRDRQKKDNHNMIERRRRFNINDRIKELGALLPKTNESYYEIVRDVRPNKGTILKSSVEYIKCLKSEIQRLRQAEAKQRLVENQNRRLLLRVQQLEQQVKRASLSTGPSAEWQPSQPPPLLLNDSLPKEASLHLATMEDLMEDDDSGPLLSPCSRFRSSDPMLSSPPSQARRNPDPLLCDPPQLALSAVDMDMMPC